MNYFRDFFVKKRLQTTVQRVVYYSDNYCFLQSWTFCLHCFFSTNNI